MVYGIPYCFRIDGETIEIDEDLSLQLVETTTSLNWLGGRQGWASWLVAPNGHSVEHYMGMPRSDENSRCYMTRYKRPPKPDEPNVRLTEEGWEVISMNVGIDTSKSGWE